MTRRNPDRAGTSDRARASSSRVFSPKTRSKPSTGRTSLGRQSAMRDLDIGMSAHTGML